jgi:hypothetical protein
MVAGRVNRKMKIFNSRGPAGQLGETAILVGSSSMPARPAGSEIPTHNRRI